MTVKADSSADRDPLDRLAEEFISRYRAGERPPLTEYANRLPDRADEVRELFPALVEMEQLKPVPGDLTGAFEEAKEIFGPRQVGEFQILRQVGRGGMGIVYEAVQQSLGRHVALKLLPVDALADPKRLERFRREAKAAARLHHTNIVPVFGTGESEGRHYYAMQFIAGHPLDAVIDEVRRLKDKSAQKQKIDRPVTEIAGAMMTGTFQANRDLENEAAAFEFGSAPSLSGSFSDDSRHYWTTVARVGNQAAEALAYAHDQGILHRDIKPANLLLDLHGTIWVTDFGLAKLTDVEDMTQTGDIIGTLRYMAPERFDGQGDHRADVYALGLTLYELLTLKPAFGGETKAKLIENVIAASPRPPRGINASIPRDLETIVLKAIQREPAMRYRSASEMGEDLRRYLEDRPISARRATNSEKVIRWCRRNPTVATLLSCILLVTSLGALGASYFAVRAGHERDRAETREQEAISAKSEADKSAAEALTLSSELKRQMVRLHLATAYRLLDSGDPVTALLWQARAWKDDTERVDAEEAHRLRVGLSFDNQMPLRKLVIADEPLLLAQPTVEHRIATLSKFGNVALWDQANQKITLPHPAKVARFQVTGEGKKLITACADGKARIWDTATGQMLFAVDHGEPVEWVAVQPRGNLLATAGGKTGIRLWCIETGEKREPRPEAPSSYFVSFSPDGQKLATGDSTDHVRAWEVATAKPLTEPLPHRVNPRGEEDFQGDRVPVFTPDSSRLLSVELGEKNVGKMSLWSLADGKRMWGPVKFGLNQHSFSPDGKRLLVTGLPAGLFDAQTGKKLANLPHPRQCQRAVFIENDSYVTSSTGGLLWHWKIEAEKPVLESKTAQFGDLVTCLAPSHHRKQVLAAGMDGTVREYALSNPETALYNRDCGRADRVYPTRGSNLSLFTPDGKLVCEFPNNAKPRIGPGKSSSLPIELGIDGPVSKIRFSGDGKSVVTYDGFRIGVWNTADGTARGPQIAVPDDLKYNYTSISRDGRRLAISTKNPPAFGIYDVPTGHCIFERRCVGAFDKINDYGDQSFPVFAISPDGRKIAWVEREFTGPMEVWDIDSGSLLSRFTPHRGHYKGMEFSADGSKIFIGSSDSTARLWHADTGNPAGTPLRHGFGLYTAAISPDARLAVTSCAGGVHLWNPINGLLFGHWPRKAADAWLSLDGRRLITVSSDKNFTVYELRPYEIAKEHLDPLTELLTGKRIVPGTDDVEFVPADFFMRNREIYLTAFAALKAQENRPDPDVFSPEFVYTRRVTELNGDAWKLLTAPKAERDAIKGLALIEEARKLDAAKFHFWNTLGVALYRNGRFNEAIGMLEKSLAAGEKGKDDPWNLFFLALCLAKRADTDKAKECYRKALGWIDRPPRLMGKGEEDELKSIRAEVEEILREKQKMN